MQLLKNEAAKFPLRKRPVLQKPTVTRPALGITGVSSEDLNVSRSGKLVRIWMCWKMVGLVLHIRYSMLLVEFVTWIFASLQLFSCLDLEISGGLGVLVRTVFLEFVRGPSLCWPKGSKTRCFLPSCSSHWRFPRSLPPTTNEDWKLQQNKLEPFVCYNQSKLPKTSIAAKHMISSCLACRVDRRGLLDGIPRLSEFLLFISPILIYRFLLQTGWAWISPWR